MRMCHTEAMKEIRELEERKARLPTGGSFRPLS